MLELKCIYWTPVAPFSRMFDGVLAAVALGRNRPLLDNNAGPMFTPKL